MNTLPLKEIIRINEQFRTKEKELQELLKETQMYNDLIDLKEIDDSLSYEELKSLIPTLIFNNINNGTKVKLFNILKRKKEEQYPELLDAHFYPVIRDLNIPVSERLTLDKNLKELFDYNYFISADIFDNVDVSNTSEIIDFLIENDIIERFYVFKCNCGYDFECNKTLVSEAEKEKFLKYHKFDINNASSEELDEYYDDYKSGFIFVHCFNGGDIEICDIDSFNKNLKYIAYKIKSKPSTYLDDI